MENPYLLFFVRWPEAGRVKSRLAETVGIQEACRIHKLLAERCYKRALKTPAVQVVVCGTGASPEKFQSWLPFADAYWDQPELGLGERLQTLFSKAFSLGATSVAAIGSDAPDLDSESIASAFDDLTVVDVSMIPATDGGYVLIGLSRPEFRIFENITWGTTIVLQQTKTICEELKLSYCEGMPFSDIDTEADWKAYTTSQLQNQT